ncbi:MAG: hypothetical protein Q7P63_11750 [Verrucomicrobiota bacterium JB022]|nr:hypothetical protein [Verrucomicrobiota bacterium JB022]
MKSRGDAALAAFRRQEKVEVRGSSWSREPYTLREKVVTAAALFACFFMLWMASGLTWKWQSIGTLVALFSFTSLFWPLPGESSRDVGSPRYNARALLKLPVFWLGAVLLAYVIISNYNIHTTLKTLPTGRIRLVRHETIAWLPSAMALPIEKDNPFIYFLLYAQPWLLVCTLGVGLRNRRAWRMCLLWLGVGLLAWLGVAFYMDFMEFERILGVWKSTRFQYPLFFGTIVAKAHVGYFLGMGVVVCLSLFFLYWRQARQRKRLVGPHWIFLLCSFLFTAAELRIFDRGPLGYLVGLWAFAILLFIITAIRERYWISLIAVTFLMCGGLFGSYAYVKQTAYGAQYEVFNREIRQTREALADWRMIDRVRSSQLALEMWEERQLFGWGAGSFRYYYLTRTKDYPDLVGFRYKGTFDRKTGKWKTLEFERDPKTGRRIGKKFTVGLNAVHNDWAQALMELGIVGFGLLFCSIGYWFAKALWHIRHWDATAWMLFVGMIGLCLTALVDFHMTTPSIMGIAAVMTVAMSRWSEARAEKTGERRLRRVRTSPVAASVTPDTQA